MRAREQGRETRRQLVARFGRATHARGSRDAVSTHGGGVRVWCSRFDRTRSNGNFVHLLPERLATSRIWSRCHEGFPSLQATGQKRVTSDNLSPVSAPSFAADTAAKIIDTVW